MSGGDAGDDLTTAFPPPSMCIIGLEGTMISPGPGSTQHTKDAATPRDTHQPAGRVDPLLAGVSPPHNSSSGMSTSDRHRRLIPYMQYYVTSTAAPPAGGTDTADYQPSFNQVYNYRPINVPVRQDPAADIRQNYYTPKHTKQQQLQQQPYRQQEETLTYDLQRPLVQHRKPYYNTKLISSTGLKSLPSVSINPFTYEYNHRHQQQQPQQQQTPVKVVSVGGSSGTSLGSPTSYSVLNTASSSDAPGGSDIYERPKYAVIPRERDQYEQVPQRFAAVLPQKLYGIEVHTKHTAEDDAGSDLPSGGGKYFLPTVASELAPSRKPTLYHTVPVTYKKKIINPFLPSNTIPGPFTPMTSGSSSSSSSSSSNSGSNSHTVSSQYQQEGGRTTSGVAPISYLKNTVTEQPTVAVYSSYDHGAPVQDNRAHSEVVSSPYVVVKTLPKYYYEKPRISVSTPAPVPYQLYFKEKPSEGRKQHSNHSGYTRPRIPGVVPVRISVDPHNHASEAQPEQPSGSYYTIGQQLYKVQEHVPAPIKHQQTLPPPRQHLTETILPQHTPQKVVVPDAGGKSPAITGQYFVGPNYKVYKVPVKHHHVMPEQSYPSYAHPPQSVATYSSTTPRPVSYSTGSPVTTAAPPVHETPLYPVYHHQSSKPARNNRTEYANRQRFYPQSMRHPSQHKPRPIPLAPATEHEHPLGLPHGAATGSLSDLLKNLQDSNLLPKTLTPDNIDNSIRTLVKILNNLKANGHHRPEVERPDLVEPAYEHTNYTTVEPETYVDTDKYRAGPPMLINKIVSPGPNTGKPGIDYPALAEIPETSFKCKDQRYKGFFGDPETNCQVWHYCDLNGGKASFLCPNGTIFSQVALTCDWWFNVKCSTTAQLYVLNERLYKYILPFTPKFPEDYSGPLVDKYLALKFQEMEEKMKQQRAKGAKQGSIEIPNAVPENDEVNGNTLEDNDERYNQNQPYPVKYVTTEAVPERVSKPVVSMPSAPGPSVPITLEDIDAELQRGNNAGGMIETSSASSSTLGPSPMASMSGEEEDDVRPPASSMFRTSSVPTTTTLIIATEEPPIDPFRSGEMMIEPEGREEEDEYANVLNTEHPASVSPLPHNLLPTAAPILSKIRRIEVKNDGTSGHLIRNPNYERRRKR
uniref:Chitin-binding type-2 domain-containing protein n=1 Tax=Anopheles minimus TaxID=112268 RepID=A0A182VUW0_9DIPT